MITSLNKRIFGLVLAIILAAAGLYGANYWRQRDGRHALIEFTSILRFFDPAITQEIAAGRLQAQRQQRALADRLGLPWRERVQAELRYYTFVQQEEYYDLLRSGFGNQENLFLKYVVEPSAIAAALRMHYYGNYQFNKIAYDRAEKLLNRILAGADFDSVAKQESDDRISGQFGGDLGFFADGELLPELENKIQEGPPGEVQRVLFISRLGYHIIKPLDRIEQDPPDGRQAAKIFWRAKHILIQTDGFEEWLAGQIARD